MEYLLSAQAASGFEHLDQTGSTNRDLLAKAKDLPEFYVLAADFQTAGRGRMDRSWEAKPKSSVMASVLLRPTFRQAQGISWLSLMTALAISESLNGFGLETKIKWPNDVLVGDKKISGILAEAASDLSCVVVGFGINVFQKPSDLPVAAATSMAIELGDSVSRDQLLAQTIQRMRVIYQELSDSDGDADLSGLREQIIQSSATVGSQVSVQFPDERKAFGLATDIDSWGRLVVQTQSETLSVSAGDVLHLRKA